jgi:hypothetical protein
MTREPCFVCLQCGQKFAESRVSGLKCDTCAWREQRRRLAAIERRFAADYEGVRRTIAAPRRRGR